MKTNPPRRLCPCTVCAPAGLFQTIRIIKLHVGRNGYARRRPGPNKLVFEDDLDLDEHEYFDREADTDVNMGMDVDPIDGDFYTRSDALCSAANICACRPYSQRLIENPTHAEFEITFALDFHNDIHVPPIFSYGHSHYRPCLSACTPHSPELHSRCHWRSLELLSATSFSTPISWVGIPHILCISWKRHEWNFFLE